MSTSQPTAPDPTKPPVSLTILHHSKLYGILLFLYALLQLAIWRYDTSLAVTPAGNSAPLSTVAGERLRVFMPVEYSHRRQCSMLMSRYFLDSTGTYFDLMATRFISSTGLIEMERASPSELRFVVSLPSEASSGDGVVVTQISSMCNPLQIVWPTDIDIRTHVRVTK
jgi:hypothetical protein